MAYRYDNYTDSFVRIDGEPNTGSTTVRVGVPLKEAVIIEKVELTDECIDKIADAVVQKFADRKTENSSEKPNNCEHITEDGVTCAKYPAIKLLIILLSLFPFISLLKSF